MSALTEPKRFVITCQFCGRPWMPQHDVSRADVYCPECWGERTAAAAKAFNSRPYTEEELKHPYGYREDENEELRLPNG